MSVSRSNQTITIPFRDMLKLHNTEFIKTYFLIMYRFIIYKIPKKTNFDTTGKEFFYMDNISRSFSYRDTPGITDVRENPLYETLKPIYSEVSNSISVWVKNIKLIIMKTAINFTYRIINYTAGSLVLAMLVTITPKWSSNKAFL